MRLLLFLAQAFCGHYLFTFTLFLFCTYCFNICTVWDPVFASLFDFLWFVFLCLVIYDLIMFLLSVGILRCLRGFPFVSAMWSSVIQCDSELEALEANFSPRIPRVENLFRPLLWEERFVLMHFQETCIFKKLFLRLVYTTLDYSGILKQSMFYLFLPTFPFLSPWIFPSTQFSFSFIIACIFLHTCTHGHT